MLPVEVLSLLFSVCENTAPVVVGSTGPVLLPLLICQITFSPSFLASTHLSLDLPLTPPRPMCLWIQVSTVSYIILQCQIYSISMTSGSVMFHTLHYKHQIYGIVTDQHHLSTTNVGPVHTQTTNVKLWEDFAFKLKWDIVNGVCALVYKGCS